MIKIKKKVMETRVNVIGYRISSTNRPRRLFDFKALIKVLQRRRYLFKRRKTYLCQVLTISQDLVPINNKLWPLWFIYFCIQEQLPVIVISTYLFHMHLTYLRLNYAKISKKDLISRFSAYWAWHLFCSDCEKRLS